MSGFLDRVLGLRHLSSGGEGVSFGFAHPLPAWAWVLIALACALAAFWSYSRLLGQKRARWSLASLRTLLLVLVAVLLCGPQLTKQNERVERDWVVVMADRSASMTIQDVDSAKGRESRDEQLQAALAKARPELDALAKTRNVLLLGFDSGIYDLPPDAALAPPAGQRTAIGQSFDFMLRRLAGKPLAGVVLLSDGRSTDEVSRTTLRELVSAQTPVFVSPLGSDKPLPDLALTKIDAPSAAFVGDVVPVTVTLDQLGDKSTPLGGKVELVDDATGLVLDSKPIPESGGKISLSSQPDQVGNRTWTVRLVLDKPDLSDENNHASFAIELADRPIRVAYFDGYPRWEYRYLKNLLVREKSIRSAILLLAPDRRYIQEGSEPLGALPKTQAEWNAIDVVVMGDLRPGLFSEDQIHSLRELVATRGGGILWIGGPSATPAAWRGTALADLLPFTLGTDGNGDLPAWVGPVVLKPGSAADRYGVLKLGALPSDPWPAELDTPSLGWPLLRWAQKLDTRTIKPTAEVLGIAQAVPTGTPDAAAPTAASAPLILTMRYGAGRIVYVGTDETWRYRYGRGESLQERLWLPLIRLLARESLGRSGKPAVLAVDPERSIANQPVQVTLRLVDQALIDARPVSAKIKIVRKGDTGKPDTETELTLRPEVGGDDSQPPSALSATWTPTDPGNYTLAGADSLLAGLDITAKAEVSLPDDELRTPQTDHAGLAALAEATKGRVVSPDQLASVFKELPNRELRLLGAPDIETLWDKPLAWTLLISLLTLEWIGRRLIKLS
ncbi:MAG: hypothetical protein WC718_08635 [Phycisphaerales bacterium]|jgi:hypothetical protein